jgi:hypothetical protein
MTVQRILPRGLILVLVAIFAVANASADVINFEQFTGPSLFANTAGPGTPQTLTIATSIGNVFVTGGVILTAAANAPADETSVYFTASPTLFGFGSTAQTITLTFPQNINNFFLNLYNGQTSPDTFTVADNLGHSNTVTLASNSNGGTSLISFPAAGSVVTITTSDRLWDFAVDNIGFNQPTPGTQVPEPGTLLLTGSGLAAICATMRRKLRRDKTRSGITT